MKTVFKFSILFVAFALLTVTMAPKSALAAGKAFHYRYSGKGADATWEVCQNENSCSYTSVYVSEMMYKNDGTPFKGTTLYYNQYSYDNMNETYTYSYGYLENPVFSIDKKLNQATTRGTVPVWSCTYNYMTGEETCTESSPVTLNVSWAGNGELTKGSSRGHWVSKSYTSNYSYRGSWRSAAANGTINGTNLGTSSWGNLFNYREANVSVCHGGC